MDKRDLNYTIWGVLIAVLSIIVAMLKINGVELTVFLNILLTTIYFFPVVMLLLTVGQDHRMKRVWRMLAIAGSVYVIFCVIISVLSIALT